MAASPSTVPVLAPRYYTRFSCIGPACENTCCSGWSILIDADHHREMRKALSQTKADREMFAKSVKRVRGEREYKKHALIVLNESTGKCNLLTDDGLCSLHQRFGERILPDVCATYPRRQSLVGDRVEVATVLSCPEAARQALLPDDAMELVDVDRNSVGRDYWVQVAGSDGSNEYAGVLDIVRAAIMQIVVGAPSTAAGLATVAAAADALGPEFSRASGQNKAIDPREVAETLQLYVDPVYGERIARGLAAIDMPLAVPMLAVLQVLAARRSMGGGNVDALITHAKAAYGIGEEAVVPDVVAAFVARRSSLGAVIEPRLDRILRNYALNHSFAHWYTNAPDLGVWVRGLILRFALVRFLVFAHPRIAPLTHDTPQEEANAAIEQASVDVIHRFTRELEHHHPFLKMLEVAMPQAMPGLEHALTLLKI